MISITPINTTAASTSTSVVVTEQPHAQQNQHQQEIIQQQQEQQQQPPTQNRYHHHYYHQLTPNIVQINQQQQQQQQQQQPPVIVQQPLIPPLSPAPQQPPPIYYPPEQQIANTMPEESLISETTSNYSKDWWCGLCSPTRCIWYMIWILITSVAFVALFNIFATPHSSKQFNTYDDNDIDRSIPVILRPKPVTEFPVLPVPQLIPSVRPLGPDDVDMILETSRRGTPIPRTNAELAKMRREWIAEKAKESFNMLQP